MYLLLSIESVSNQNASPLFIFLFFYPFILFIDNAAFWAICVAKVGQDILYDAHETMLIGLEDAQHHFLTYILLWCVVAKESSYELYDIWNLLSYSNRENCKNSYCSSSVSSLQHSLVVNILNFMKWLYHCWTSPFIVLTI